MSEPVESNSEDAPEIVENMESHPVADLNQDSSEKTTSTSTSTVLLDDEPIAPLNDNECIEEPESDYIFDHLYEKEDETYEAICKYDAGPRDDYNDDMYD